jgi:hypothetical protein
MTLAGLKLADRDRGTDAPAGRGGRLPLAVLALLAGLAGLAGCASPPAPVPLPHKAIATSGQRAASAGQTRRQAVVAAYVESWSATTASLDARSASRARAILTPYLTAGLVRLTVRADEEDWSADEVADGSVVPHVLGVRFSGGRAYIHDCADFSHAGLRSLRTGVIPTSFGKPRVNLIVTLVRRRGRWLVSDMVPVLRSCTP